SIGEAEAVKEIYLGSENALYGDTILSLRGIEYFTSLEKLFVRNQSRIESPDLSKNTGLKEFLWDRCRGGTEAIDLSENTLLTFLQYGPMQYDPDIKISKEIDISNNTLLEHLQLKGVTATSLKTNKLLKKVFILGWPQGTYLDFSNNTLLEDLYILGSRGSNVESVLNIGNCKNLNTIYIETLDIYKLDLQQSDKLKEVLIKHCDSLNYVNLSGAVNLEKFTLEDIKNEVEINVSNCKNLRGLGLGVASLKKLNASGCDAMTGFHWNEEYGGKRKLKSLDFSNCMSLTDLRCRNSELEELNVSGCRALKTLICGNNKVKELDVSACVSLETFYCSSNELEKLDVSACGALKELSCVENRLKELDVSACALLESLSCYNNELEELNVSGCGALGVLYCEFNGLKELDVSSCVSLKQLKCSANKLKTLDLYECRALERVWAFMDELETITVYKDLHATMYYDDSYTQVIRKE
ncbi:MAG: hypothetical protein LBJ23_01590, partial [Tannerella sp.]|nr:hypothetical protein [Tannerella sp.]